MTQNPVDADLAWDRIELTPASAGVVARMTELGLWTDRGQAALFLAALALARGEAAIPESEMGPERTTLRLDDDLGGDEHLALFSLASDSSAEPATVPGERLTGWIEAGATILGPRIEDASVLEATGEIRALLASIAGASS